MLSMNKSEESGGEFRIRRGWEFVKVNENQDSTDQSERAKSLANGIPTQRKIGGGSPPVERSSLQSTEEVTSAESL